MSATTTTWSDVDWSSLAGDVDGLSGGGNAHQRRLRRRRLTRAARALVNHLSKRLALELVDLNPVGAFSRVTL